MTAFVLLVCLSCVGTPVEQPALTDAQIASLVTELTAKDFATRKAAADKLVAAGPTAASATDSLIKLLDSEDSRVYAVNILGAIGPKAKAAVPALIAIVPKMSSYLVENVAVALMRIDSPKIEATRALLLARQKCARSVLLISQTLREQPDIIVQQLVTICSDRDGAVRVQAIRVLAELNTKNPESKEEKTHYQRAGNSTKNVPATLEMLLGDTLPEVRYAATLAIAELCPERAEKCLPVLIALAEQTQPLAELNPGACARVLNTIPKIAVKSLIPMLTHQKNTARTWAIATLAHLPVIEELQNVLATSSVIREREGAATALGSMRYDSAKITPALKTALSDAAFPVRFAAANAMLSRGTASKEDRTATVPVFTEALNKKLHATRVEAAYQLRELGEIAKLAIPTLKQLLSGTALDLRLRVALAVIAIDKAEAPATVPALVAGLQSKHELDVTTAVQTLGNLGSVANNAVPQLVKLYKSPSHSLRIAAAIAVTKIDPKQAKAAADVLVAILRDPVSMKNSRTRELTIETLAQMGPAASEAIPLLRELLKTKPQESGEILVAIYALDPKDATAMAAVREAINSPTHANRYEALESLGKLGAVAKPFVPDIVELLKAKQRSTKNHAIDILEQLGEHAKDAIPAIKAIAKTETEESVKTQLAELVELLEKQ